MQAFGKGSLTSSSSIVEGMASLQTASPGINALFYVVWTLSTGMARHQAMGPCV